MSVVIVGAGGHGREVLQALRDAGGECVGFLDDHEPDPDLLKRIDAAWLGPTSELQHMSDVQYLVGIGAGRVRKVVDEKATRWGVQPATLIHPWASVGPDVEVGPGCVVFAFATVTTNIRLGRHAHVGRGVAVGHDSTLGDYVSVYPNAAISGNVTLGDGATVGTTACVRQGQAVGAGSMVGAGAVVVSDVPAGATVVGVPATRRQ